MRALNPGTAETDRERPALLGGRPVRPQGPPAWPVPDAAVVAAIQRAAEAGAWGKYLGGFGEELHRRLSEYHGVDGVWLCSSGTAAVELALRGLGVGPGDEVILAAYDFKANFTDILALGATPVLVDVRPDDWQLDGHRIEAALTPQTKAVIATHLHGGRVDLEQVRKAIGERRIGILEDACQCPGSLIDGRRAGTLGDVGVLSFGGSKLTAAGRGGAILTRQPSIIERIRRHVLRGNDLSPLSELQSAALIPQWQSLDQHNERRLASARRLFESLREFPALRMLASPSSADATGYYKVGMEYAPELLHGLSRNAFSRAMWAEGIALSPGFRGLHRIHAARRFRAGSPLAVADRVDERVVVLHHPVLLGTEDDVDQVITAARKVSRFAAELAARQSEWTDVAEDCDE